MSAAGADLETRVATAPATAPLPPAAQRALTWGLLLSAIRCVLQYILLPFVLPWIGFASSVPTWVFLLLCLLAILSIIRNVRFLLQVHHARRWSYFGLALVTTTILLVFVGMDLARVLG